MRGFLVGAGRGEKNMDFRGLAEILNEIYIIALLKGFKDVF